MLHHSHIALSRTTRTSPADGNVAGRDPRRKGVATVWLIATGPALLLLLILVTDIGNVWLARIELVNACEAAALAGAKVWGDAPVHPTPDKVMQLALPDRIKAWTAAQIFGKANLVLQDEDFMGELELNMNPAPPGSTLLPNGDIQFGKLALAAC